MANKVVEVPAENEGCAARAGFPDAVVADLAATEIVRLHVNQVLTGGNLLVEPGCEVLQGPADCAAGLAPTGFPDAVVADLAATEIVRLHVDQVLTGGNLAVESPCK